ncbi:MAG: MFS transporter [Hyphomonadaceae bacterium]|nr:MFS transporter [Hyphomonadaceae bacterium]
MAGAHEDQQAQIGAMLDAPGAWRRRALAPVLLGVLMLFDSWDSVMIAFIMPTLSREWGLEPIAMGALMSSGYAGQLVGAIALGALAERWGRKPVYSAAIVVMSLLSVACAAAQTPEQLGALRFVQGLAIGGAVPVCASYINEIAPTKTRGRFFSVFQFLMVSGYAAAAVTSALIIEQVGWRVMFVLGAAPLLVLPFAMALLPESPRWLARIGRPDAALAAIRKLGGAAEAALAATPAAANAAARTRFADLFARDVRWTVATLVALWFLTSLVNFGLTNWAPSIYVSVFHIPVAEALRFASISVIVILVAPIVLGALMDKVGRRPLAIFGTLVGGAVLLSLLAMPQGEVGLIVAAVVLGHTGIGIGTIILWPFSAETFPTRIRAMALGLCSAAARTASMLTPLLVGGLIASTGSVQPVFAIFGVLGLGVAAIWAFAARETKGVRVDEVRAGASAQ